MIYSSPTRNYPNVEITYHFILCFPKTLEKNIAIKYLKKLRIELFGKKRNEYLINKRNFLF